MDPITTLLEKQGVILLDGAMGTLLFAAGLGSGQSPELWNVTHPEEIQSVHRQYIEAGAQIILTNTFGGSRVRLGRNGLQERAAELNQAAAANARAAVQASGQTVLVAGSMGPSGELMQPFGTLSPEAARESFAEQAAALAAGGADLLWIETMSDLNEVWAAIEGARSGCDLPIAVTMTFEKRGRTMMGVTPTQALSSLAEAGLALVGANCGNGPDEIEAVLEQMQSANPPIPLIAKANAGLPQMIDGQVTYTATPEDMAAYALRARQLGARLIGGCCGTTPEHIRAMSAALKS